MTWPLAKAHAYGNDFLYLETPELDRSDWGAHAVLMCARHTGAGADGLIVYREQADGARMRLLNADGSPSEVSGNGVRGLGALLAWRAAQAGRAVPRAYTIGTDAGPKELELLERTGSRAVFRAAMGHPTDPERRRLTVGTDVVDVVVLRVGNPQCIVLDTELSEARYRRLGPELERHPAFPEGTNVEFAVVEARDRIRILIWERGVGPTSSSGTGACGAAVAAMTWAGVDRSATVVSVGGEQRVEWNAAGLFLTGWAEVVWEGRWIR